MSTKVGARTKGWIKNEDTKVIKSFQFNPTELTFSRGATYTEIASPGMSYPLTQFVHGNAREFPITLFLYDKPSTGIIEEYMLFFDELLPPETNSTSFIKPPEITFCFGSFIRRCVVVNVETNIQEFDEKGKPTVVTVSLQLRQVGI